MECYQDLYDQFLAIVGEGTCTDEDIKKYILWGNGNLEVSLNYYFQQQAKTQSFFKGKTSTSNKTQAPPSGKNSTNQKGGVTTRSSNQNQQKQQQIRDSGINSNLAAKNQQINSKPDPPKYSREDYDDDADEEEDKLADHRNNQYTDEDYTEYKAKPKPTVNAFTKLQEGSKKMREFDKMVEQLREEYKKPVSSIVEKKLSINKDEYSNDFNDAQNLNNQDSHSMDPSLHVNLDYLPSILRRPEPQEVIPEHFSSKPHLDSAQMNLQREFQMQAEQRKSKEQRPILRKSDSIYSDDEEKNKKINSAKEYFGIIKEENNVESIEYDFNYEAQKVQKYEKPSSQDKKQPSSTQSLNYQHQQQQYSSAIHAPFIKSETTINDHFDKRENSSKKTVNYDSFEQGLDSLQRGDEQQLSFPCYLGSFYLTGHALTSSRCDMKKGDDIILKIERNIQTTIGKNKQKPKKSAPPANQQMIIRLVWREKEVGRVDNNFAQVLYPLIDRNYIFIQGQFESAPVYLQAFSQIRVAVKVSLMRCSITKPITQIIEENANNKESQILKIYSETKDQFAQLFEWLRLQLLTPTLIQVKGRKKNEQSFSTDKNDKNIQPTQQSYSNLNSSHHSSSSSDEKGGEQIKVPNKMVAEDEERELNQKQQMHEESVDFCKVEENAFEIQNNENEDISKKMIAEEPNERNNSDMKDFENNSNFKQQQYRLSDSNNSSAVPKININDPFVKLPKQKTLLSFKMQVKKPEENFAQIDRSARQSNNDQSLVKQEDKSENNMDYEQIFNLVPGADGQAAELQYSEPPQTFKTSLHNYQKQALTWMLSREGKQTNMNEQIKRDTRTLHPLWEKYALPTTLRFFLYFNPYSGQISTSFPRAQSDCRGGILADEMGLGKTVMMISLIHSNKKKNHSYVANAKEEEDFDLTDDLNNFLSLKTGSGMSSSNQGTITAAFKPKQKNQTLVQMAQKDAGTLIIVPVTLLQQWMDEIVSHSSPNSVTYYAYYGSSRNANLNNYDVVITTYGTISSEFASSQNVNTKNLYKYNWHRIVLDEAHYIKGRVIQIAKAVYGLTGDNRWCMTGTPLQNKLDELFPLIHFIKLEPWSDYIWFNNYINKPHEKGEVVVYDVLKTILRPILMRRTKKSKDINGQSIISLPEKHCCIQNVQFTPEERMFYDQVHQRTKEEFDGFLNQGVLLSNYMKVFELLLRLRQISDHIFLLTTRGDVTNTDGLENKIRSFVDRRNKALKDQSEQIEKKSTAMHLHNQVNQLELLESSNASNETRHSHFEMILDENNNEQRIEIPDNFNFDYSDAYLNKVVEDIKYNNIPTCNICLEDMEDAVLTACLHISCRLCSIRSIEYTGMCPICRKFITKEDIMTVPRNNRFAFDPTQKYVRSSKINAVMTYIEKLKNGDDKCLLFTQFLGMMDLFEIDFKKQNIPYLRLDGSVSQKQRADIIKRFNEESQYKVFMISLKAGGVGLNLVKANHVLMVDPWWNPAVEEQAIERCHRIGQKKEVFVTRFICEDSIESRMIKLHDEKRDLFENTIQATKKDKKEQNIEHFKYLMSTY